MANRVEDIAIRQGYFEDTLLMIGEFDFLGHAMNYVLRVSSFGSKGDKANVQIYFGLLDDTMRDFSEARHFYEIGQTIIDKDRLWLRSESVELRETMQGLKVYVNDDAITLDFVVQNDGVKIDLRTLEKMGINNRLEGYSYPYCLSEGTALIGENYGTVQGTLFYMRRYQNHPGRYDKRIGQTSLLRGFSRSAQASQEPEANSLYGFFTLSNGKRVVFGYFGDGREQDDYLVVTAGNNTSEHKIKPIQAAIHDTGDEERPDKDVLVLIQSADDEFTLKMRRVLTLTDNLSPEKKDFKLYDRFVRLSGNWNGSKITGCGCLVMT